MTLYVDQIPKLLRAIFDPEGTGLLPKQERIVEQVEANAQRATDAASRTDGLSVRDRDAAIAEAQAAYDRGEMTLLEATFLADALSGVGPQDCDADTLHWTQPQQEGTP